MQNSAFLNLSFHHRFAAVTLLLSGFGLVSTANAGTIVVTSNVAPTSSTCTLAQRWTKLKSPIYACTPSSNAYGPATRFAARSKHSPIA